MTQATTNHRDRTHGSPGPRDSPVRWALNALPLQKNLGSAVAIQERDGSIFVCVRKGEATDWVQFQKVMGMEQLQAWIRDGGFPRGSAHPGQR